LIREFEQTALAFGSSNGHVEATLKLWVAEQRHITFGVFK